MYCLHGKQVEKRGSAQDDRRASRFHGLGVGHGEDTIHLLWHFVPRHNWYGGGGVGLASEGVLRCIFEGVGAGLAFAFLGKPTCSSGMVNT